MENYAYIIVHRICAICQLLLKKNVYVGGEGEEICDNDLSHKCSKWKM